MSFFFSLSDITQNSDEWKIEIENLRREIRQLSKIFKQGWNIGLKELSYKKIVYSYYFHEIYLPLDLQVHNM